MRTQAEFQLDDARDELRVTEKRHIPSLIKWSGSKRYQASLVASLAPDTYVRYFEPFLGGGALMFLLAGRGAVGGDVYKPLIDLWRMIRDEPDEVVADYSQKWVTLQDNLPDYFYQVRERFNKKPNPLDLLLLSRTCVNGIIRFNKYGHFNNSFHLSRRGMHPTRFRAAVSAWSQRIQEVSFRDAHAEDTLAEAREGDFVYLDPPYANNRARYLEDFATGDLLNILEGLNAKGVLWALSYDGRRGNRSLQQEIPAELYVDHRTLPNGLSAVRRVLSGALDDVHESLYRNYN